MANRSPGSISYVETPHIVSRPYGDLSVTVHTVQIRGEMDIESAPAIRDALGRLVAEGRNHIIIDLQEVPYLDSTALGVLLTALKRVLEKRGRLVLVSNNPKINRVFSITGVSKILSLYATEAEALESFKEPS